MNPAEAPPSGITYTDGYDGNGNAIYSVDGNGVGTEQQYDPLNRLIKTLRDHAGTGATHDTTTQYAYDVRDNLRSVTDPDNLTTSYTYDGLNNLTPLSSPDAGSSTYTYDSAGHRKTKTDARGVVSTYSYDALNRLTNISYPTTSLNVTYNYDQGNGFTGCAVSYRFGRLTSFTDSSGSTFYCYDVRGNILSKKQVTNGVTLITAYSYTLSDRLATITYPSGAIVSYGRDVDGRIISIGYKASSTATSVTLVSNVTYYPYGPTNVITYGNGRTLTKTYDQDYAIDKVVSSDPNGLVIDATVDSLGNLINASSAVGASPPTQKYIYDNLYRLTGVQSGSGTSYQAFTYNKTGDRTSETSGSGSTSTYVYSSPLVNHHLLNGNGIDRGYDEAGNSDSGPAIFSDGIFESPDYLYDDRNRLTEIVLSCLECTNDVLYDFNGKGERVVKTTQSGRAKFYSKSTYFAYNEQGQLLTENEGALNDSTDYVYLDTTPVAMATGGTLYYIESDQLNTPRIVIQPGSKMATDTVVWKWDYFDSNSAFGENAPRIQTVTFNLRFPGQYYDVETGLNYNYFRDYEPQTGRYIESDPIGLIGGINTYAYVRGNPISYFDSSGLAIGDFPPPPPDYNPNTWTTGMWDSGRFNLTDPDRNMWTIHPEDDGHWRHWDKQDDDGNDDGQWPPNSGKPWPGQKKLKPNQCESDPNGDASPWNPNMPMTHLPGFPFLPLLDGPILTPAPAPILIPIFP